MGNTNATPHVDIPGVDTHDNTIYDQSSVSSNTGEASSESSFALSEGAMPQSFEVDAPRLDIPQGHSENNSLEHGSDNMDIDQNPSNLKSEPAPQAPQHIDILHQSVNSGDLVGETHEDRQNIASNLSIPDKVYTYADLTNLAMQFPDSALSILKLPLPATWVDVVYALMPNRPITLPVQDNYLQVSPKSLSPHRKRAHTPDCPDWALAPDEPHVSPEPSKGIKHDPLTDHTTPRIDCWRYPEDTDGTGPVDPVFYSDPGDNNMLDHVHKNVSQNITPVPNILVNEFELEGSVSEWLLDSIPIEDTHKDRSSHSRSTVDDFCVGDTANSWEPETQVDSWLMPPAEVGYLEVPKPVRTERRKGWDLEADPYEDQSSSTLHKSLRLASQDPEQKSFQTHASYPILPDRKSRLNTLWQTTAVADPSPPRRHSPLLEDALKAIVLQPQPSAAVPIRSPYHPPTRASPTNLGGRPARVLSFFPHAERDERGYS